MFAPIIKPFSIGIVILHNTLKSNTVPETEKEILVRLRENENKYFSPKTFIWSDYKLKLS